MDLEGRTITKVRPMLEAEANREGWDWGWEGVCVLELDDGSIIYASRDDEGNGPGAIFGHGTDGKDFAIYAAVAQPAESPKLTAVRAALAAKKAER